MIYYVCKHNYTVNDVVLVKSSLETSVIPKHNCLRFIGIPPKRVGRRGNPPISILQNWLVPSYPLVNPPDNGACIGKPGQQAGWKAVSTGCWIYILRIYGEVLGNWGKLCMEYITLEQRNNTGISDFIMEFMIMLTLDL